MADLTKTFSGERIAQRPDELAEFVRLLKKHKVQSYLEIGARHGDTFHHIGMALGEGVKLTCIEMPEGPWGKQDSHEHLKSAISDLRANGRDVELLLGSSHSPKIISAARKMGPYDAIFIDGDHSIVGVVQDWLNYSPMGKIIAFHDIAPSARAVEKGVRVQHLWGELRGKHRVREIYGIIHGMGIGVVFRED